LQPQAPEVEKAVLGALMIDKDAYLEVCDILRPESFYEPRHQKVYAAIRQLSME
jgi:replicative DNA helicase